MNDSNLKDARKHALAIMNLLKDKDVREAFGFMLKTVPVETLQMLAAMCNASQEDVDASVEDGIKFAEEIFAN